MNRNIKAIIISLIAIISLASCTSEEEKAQKELMLKATIAGDQITTVAFQSLSGHLKGAMSSGGIENAIAYCNLNAMPLTDSLSKDFDVKIKRTSVRLRNQHNQPDTLEAYMLDLYQQILKMQKPMVGKAILAKDNRVRYFAPIMVKSQCLACHGTVGKETAASTYSIITDRYPADIATGYAEGELRGIWSIDYGDISNLAAKIDAVNSKIPELDN